MTLNEYQDAQMRTAPIANYNSNQDMLVNAAMGICGEGGELMDAIKKFLYQGHVLDRDALRKELGDVLWYVSLGAASLGNTLEEIAEMNVEKLRKRYPDGFDADRSVNRKEYGDEG